MSETRSLGNNTPSAGHDVESQAYGQTLWLTLNRPEAGNKLTTTMLIQIADAIRQANADKSINTLMLNANGPDFCLGGELGRYWDMDPKDIQQFADAFIDALLQIRGSAIPVILSAVGRVWGGGVCLLDAADVVIVRKDISIAIPEVISGRPPVLSFIGSFRNIPEKTVMRMALSGEAIDASEALRIGLVSLIADDEPKQKELCETWIDIIIKAGSNTTHVIKQLRTAADCTRYDQQLRSAGAMLAKALLPDTPDIKSL